MEIKHTRTEAERSMNLNDGMQYEFKLSIY